MREKRKRKLSPNIMRNTSAHGPLLCKHPPPNNGEARPLMNACLYLSKKLGIYSLKIHSKIHLAFFCPKIVSFQPRIANPKHISKREASTTPKCMVVHIADDKTQMPESSEHVQKPEARH